MKVHKGMLIQLMKYIAGLLTLILMVVHIQAQDEDNIAILIYIVPDYFVVYITEDAEPMPIEQLNFRTAQNGSVGSPENVSRENFSSLILTDGIAETGDCFIWEMPERTTPLPDVCSDDDDPNVIAPGNRFWTNNNGDQLDVLIYWDDQPLQTCSTQAARCEITNQAIPTPTSTPIPPTPTDTPDGIMFPTREPGTLLPREIWEQANSPVQTNSDWTPYSIVHEGHTLMLVPVGSFDMGSDSISLRELPITPWTIDTPFFIDRYEVSQGQYNDWCANTESCTIRNSGNPTLPATYVTWEQALEYCESRGGRLPTEIEWEYVARGPDNNLYPWPGTEISREYANYDNDNPQSVLAYVAGESWVGARNMSGNVAEWTSTEYMHYGDDTRYPRDNSPLSETIVIRGGSYFDTMVQMQAAARGSQHRTASDQFTGFRCVIPIE